MRGTLMRCLRYLSAAVTIMGDTRGKGASGARILTTLAHEMGRRPEARYGLATMCTGVAQGNAMVLEA